MKAIIIGAGITGLSLAWYLDKHAPDLDYVILEASDKSGGKVRTTYKDDCILEGGPDSMVIQKPAVITLCEDLGMGDQFINSFNNQVRILYDNELKAIPKGLKLIVPVDEKLFRKNELMTEKGVERTLDEASIPAQKSEDDESLASFIRRRFGDECLDRLAGPLLGGIYVADPEKLSMKAAFPKFLEMENKYGSISKAMSKYTKVTKVLPERAIHEGGLIKGIKSAFKSSTKKSTFLSLKGGMYSMITTLESKIKGKVKHNTAVKSISKKGDQYSVQTEDETYNADFVISTIPANFSAKLFSENPELQSALNDFDIASTATLSFIFKRADIKTEMVQKEQGFIIADKKGYKILSSTISSNKYPERSPEELLLIRVYFGGQSDIDISKYSDQEMIGMALEELNNIYQIEADYLDYDLHRYTDMIPQYNLGHLDKVANLEAIRPEKLFFTGCFFRGVGMSDCVSDAENTAKKISQLSN